MMKMWKRKATAEEIRNGVHFGSAEEFMRTAHENTLIDYSENGRCREGCGSCCVNFLPMTEKELQRIKNYIKANHIEPEQHCVHACARVVADLTCPMMDTETKKCKIYPVRPYICRAYTCHGSFNMESRHVMPDGFTISHVLSMRAELNGWPSDMVREVSNRFWLENEIRIHRGDARYLTELKKVLERW